jgi:hypothetical protein
MTIDERLSSPDVAALLLRGAPQPGSPQQESVRSALKGGPVRHLVRGDSLSGN